MFSSSIRVFTLLAASLVCGTYTSASAGPSHALPPPPRLVVVAAFGKGAVLTRFSFGHVRARTNPRIAHTFLLRNPSRSPVTLDRLEPSCPCVHAAYATAPPTAFASPLRTLLPGQTVALRVTMDPTDRGAITKYVWVFVRGRSAPAVTLTLTGTIRD